MHNLAYLSLVGQRNFYDFFDVWGLDQFRRERRFRCQLILTKTVPNEDQKGERERN